MEKVPGRHQACTSAGVEMADPDSTQAKSQGLRDSRMAGLVMRQQIKLSRVTLDHGSSLPWLNGPDCRFQPAGQLMFCDGR
jgi:hypothetical protein